MIDSLGEVILGSQSYAQVIVGESIARIHSQCLFEMIDSLGEVILGGAGDAQVIVGESTARMHSQRVFEQGHGVMPITRLPCTTYAQASQYYCTPDSDPTPGSLHQTPGK